MLHLEKKDFLHFFHQLKPPLLLYIRVLLVIYLAQKHTLLPNPKRIVPVKPAVNHIFFLGFRMKSHIFNDVILVLKMLIYSVDFYFAFFHYFVSSFLQHFYLPWHCLYFFPLPHGHGSFLPIFGIC